MQERRPPLTRRKASQGGCAMAPRDLRVDAIPVELRDCDRWVCWRYAQRGDKLTKEPISPRTGTLASVTEPGTWATFDAAYAFATFHELPGVGFVLTGDDDIAGVD